MKNLKFDIICLFLVVIGFSVNAQNDTITTFFDGPENLSSDSANLKTTAGSVKSNLNLIGNQNETRKQKAKVLIALAESELKENNRVDA